MPQTARRQWARYGTECHFVTESALVGWKSFLLNSVDGRVRICRPKNRAFQLKHILSTTVFGGGGVAVWECFSLNCKLDLYVRDGTLTGKTYRNQILRPFVVSHFDSHSFTSRPTLLDDNATPQRATILESHESDKRCMRISRTHARIYPKVSKHLWIRDCFGSGMITVPLKQTEALGSRNEGTCSGTVQVARRLYSLLTVSWVIHVENLLVLISQPY